MDRLQSYEAIVNAGRNRVEGWKNALFSSQIQERMRCRFAKMEYANDLSLPIDKAGRSYSVEAEGMHLEYGSLFATNKAHRMSSNGDHNLDGCYAVGCKGGGSVLALGDGSGGHFGDATQDAQVARASYFGSKMACRLLSMHKDPVALTRDLARIVDAVSNEIERKSTEATTLLACRIFPGKEKSRLVGFNVGDSLAFAWDPITKKILPVAPSVCSDAGTAILPTACKAFEKRLFDVELPSHALLFLCTDGVVDFLPVKTIEGTYPNQLTYREKSPVSLECCSQLEQNASLQAYSQAIVDLAFRMAEQERTKVKGADQLFGDDYLLLSTSLGQQQKGCTVQ